MPDHDPIILVVRHPDYSDEIELYGVEARTVYIDLGSSFDTTPDSPEEAREWAEGTWAEVADLPSDHPAREAVLHVIGYTVEEYFSVSVKRNKLVLGKS